MDKQDGRSPAGRAAAAAQSNPQAVSSKADIPNALEKITLAEFRERLAAQGVAREHSAFCCPVCGTIQSMASLIVAGASPDEAERLVGFSCEGRLTGAGAWPREPSKKRKAIRGCDWSLGGLFRIHKLEVVAEDGAKHPFFAVATPEDAQALAQGMALREDPQGAEGEACQPGDEVMRQTPTKEPLT